MNTPSEAGNPVISSDSATPPKDSGRAKRMVGQVLQRRQVIDRLHRGAELGTLEIRVNEQAPALVVAAHARRSLTERDVGHRLEWHGGAARGGHRQVLECREALAAFLEEAHADRHLAVGQRELGAVLVQVAEGRDADGLADALDRDSELRGEIEVRVDQDLRPRQVVVDTRIAYKGQCPHLLDHLARGGVGELRVLAGDVDVDVAPVAVALEVQLTSGWRAMMR